MTVDSFPLTPTSPSFAAAVLAVLREGVVVDIDPESPDSAVIDTLNELGWNCSPVEIKDPDGAIRSFGYRLGAPYVPRTLPRNPLIVQMHRR